MRIIKLIPFLLLTILLAACSLGPASATPSMDMVSTVVAAALTAIPSPPPATPYPTYTLYPTADLSGLYCEYGFCIGHPADFPFFDLEVVNDYTTSRSDYSQGNLIGFNEQLYLFLIWSQFSGDFDPNSALTFVLNQDTPGGVSISEDIGGRLVTYISLQSTPSELVPFGLAAVWKCSDRWFGWKAYTPQDGQALNLLWDALGKFSCKV
jgi:hypothetical protein